MPTIEVKISDFESLLQEKITGEKLEILLERVKGEVKDFLPEEDLAKIELNDTNRPDLWSPEGIVRQIRQHQDSWRQSYAFFNRNLETTRRVNVSKEVDTVRPYLAASVALGMTVTEDILEQLIQTQEKLADTFGRKRQTVSIGLYRLQKITFPVEYKMADPETTSFVPLGFEALMSLKEILAKHPKGMAYAGTLQGVDRYPILVDAKGTILSFPPIINSREIGEVAVGDAGLFVEVTGTDLRMVCLALNIFSCNLADRGATIEPVVIDAPQETPFGSEIKMPYNLSEPMDLNLNELNRVLGETIEITEAVSVLESYGHDVQVLYGTKSKGSETAKLTITPPPYRDDIMHPIDLIEDFAIGRGYDSFNAEMPSSFTVGGLSQIEQFSDRLREAMVGFGFEEVVSNILGSREDFIEKMGMTDAAEDRPEQQIIEIENPMTERFSLLRSWLLPALLRVEGSSSKAFYPHRIFEVGEVTRLSDVEHQECETKMNLAVLMAHPSANFSELHAILEALFRRISTNYALSPCVHPAFIEGRVGKIVVDNQEVGLIGEVAPAVLTAWQIGMPTVVFELSLENL